MTELPRPDLLARAMASCADRVVLVCAPPGFGKTVLMQQMRMAFARSGVPAAWVNLDAVDNDADALMSALGVAVAELDGPSSQRVATDPLGTLAGAEHRFALFFDDVEALHEPGALEIVRAVIAHMPRSGTVIFGSRERPQLGLARLRARGELQEIDADMLRLTTQETAEYLRRRGHLSSMDTTERLRAKTEGWIAALVHATAAMERDGLPPDEFVDRFSGSSQSVAEYLGHTMLETLPPATRDFLLRTCVLRKLHPTVCQLLAPESNALAMLRHLEAQNVLVTAQADAASFRHHSLFAEFLRASLQRQSPALAARMHLLASGWHELHGSAAAAIDHAIEGEDNAHAMHLLERHAQRFLEEGRMRMLAHWFGVLDARLVALPPVLQAVAAWSAVFTQGPAAASADLVRWSLSTNTQKDVSTHVRALVPMILAMQDRYDEAMEVALVGLPMIPSGNAFADSVLLDTAAHVSSIVGAPDRARAMIDRARHNASHFSRMFAESVEGLLYLQGGRLRDATVRFRGALGGDRGGARTGAWAGVLLARVLYEGNDLHGAEQLVDVHLPLVRDIGLPGHLIAAYLVRARTACLRGDWERTWEALDVLEQLGHERSLPRLVGSARLERARLLLLLGDSAASSLLLDRAEAAAPWKKIQSQRLPANDTDFLALGRLRWTIHFGDARSTLRPLEAAIAEARAQDRVRRALALSLLLALAQHRGGNPVAGADTLRRVLRDARTEGFVRLILDEGPTVRAMLQSCHDALLETPQQVGDAALADFVHTLLQADCPALSSRAEDLEPQGLTEPLTPKELQVLALVARGLSNAAVSAQLELSESTVRTHLRNINSKLGTSNRAAAVAVARRLGALP